MNSWKFPFENLATLKQTVVYIPQKVNVRGRNIAHWGACLHTKYEFWASTWCDIPAKILSNKQQRSVYMPLYFCGNFLQFWLESTMHDVIMT